MTFLSEPTDRRLCSWGGDVDTFELATPAAFDASSASSHMLLSEVTYTGPFLHTPML